MAQKASKDLQDLFHQGAVNVRDSEIEAFHLLRQTLVADLTKCQDELTDVQGKVVQLDAETKTLINVAKQDFSEVKEQGDLNREEIGKLRQKLTEVGENLSNDISSILNAVDDFNRQLNKRDDLEKAFEIIHDDVDVVRNSLQNVVFELNETQSQVANFETNLASVKCRVQEVANEAASNKNTISGLQKDIMEVTEQVDTLKGNASQGENNDDGEMLCTAPRRLTSFTGRKSALEWLERNLVL